MVAPSIEDATVSVIASFLLKILSHAITQQIILLGLREAAKRSDNTIDDQVVSIVEAGYKNRVNPITRAGGAQ